MMTVTMDDTGGSLRCLLTWGRVIKDGKCTPYLMSETATTFSVVDTVSEERLDPDMELKVRAAVRRMSWAEPRQREIVLQ